MKLQRFSDLLELIDVTGAIITMDAMGNQTEIIKQIVGSISIWQRDLTPQPPSLRGKGEQDL